MKHSNSNMFTYKSESALGLNFYCLFESEGLLKVTGSHTVNVAVSQKWCKMKSLLLQTTS